MVQASAYDGNALDLAFADFMCKTEAYLNDQTMGDARLYKDCKGTRLENVALRVLHKLCVDTPFKKENIILVSGHSFPDIETRPCYGVEVKTTEKDSWTSTGSSIVESTRNENIKRIYMLFGKLGGERAEFRCRPYEKCLSNIAVTHSPRYLIDMDLSQNGSPTIFDKMAIGYDEFRVLDECEKVLRLRKYYKKQAIANGKMQMPWWMGETESTEATAPVVSLYNEQSAALKDKINVRMFVLFPFDIIHGKYQRAALWMCTRFSVIMPNMRDIFSAGGKIECLGKLALSDKMPQVLQRIYNYRVDIVALLKHLDSQTFTDIAYNWDDMDLQKPPLDAWLDKVNYAFARHRELSGLDIREIFSDVL